MINTGWRIGAPKLFLVPAPNYTFLQILRLHPVVSSSCQCSYTPLTSNKCTDPRIHILCRLFNNRVISSTPIIVQCQCTTAGLYWLDDKLQQYVCLQDHIDLKSSCKFCHCNDSKCSSLVTTSVRA